MNAESIIARVVKGESIQEVLESVTEAPSGMHTRKLMKKKAAGLYKFLSDREDLQDVAVDFESNEIIDDEVAAFMKKHKIPSKYEADLQKLV